MAFLNESHIEEADIKLFESLGYTHINAWKHKLIGRNSLKDVILIERLRTKLQELNPHIPHPHIEKAIKELTRNRSAQSPIIANQEVYELVKEGIPIRYKDAKGNETDDYIRIIDLKESHNNEFLVVSQLSIQRLETINHRRPDLLLYVNGLPLVMIELKNASEKVKIGYDKNLKDYREDIPQLFWYNLFVCISNGIQTRVGSFSADWGHFFSWAKLKDTAVSEGEPSRTEIEAESKRTGKKLTLQIFGEGLCNKDNFLDYFENFVLYHNQRAKIIAKNHQYLGVNNAVQALENRKGKKGKLGVFWHTQGSGKSYSMIFFSRKIRRKITGNWSFLILTDRKDLDEQIYRNFVETQTIPAISKGAANPYRPNNRTQLRDYLASNKSYVFTLIHKFGIEKGRTYPQLTDRDNWIVMVDEAHRTQYKDLGENMRIALPNAEYIAFTGTPLLGNELTKDWFGPYISEYNFAQSIEDGATVPLYYKKSVPRVEQVNEDLVAQAAAILENEELTEKQQQQLDREYSTLLQVVRRPDRLQEIAGHIVKHYPYRLDVRDDAGFKKPMKAMVICIDKFTAVRMYDMVQAAQAKEIIELRRKMMRASGEEKQRYADAIAFMNETRMAVVISREGSEKEEKEKFAKAGLNITPHRELKESADADGRNIEDYFKDINNTYRIVFVTAMWMTGFDAPSVSTLYLDKPLQNHTLMQTIARANRVLAAKKNGLIIDYFGVFRNLKKALSSYAEGSKGKSKDDNPDDFPVKEFEELLGLLNEGIAEAKKYCKNLGADIDKILDLGEKDFKEVELFRDYANLLLQKDEYKKQLGLYVNTLNALYDSAKPDIYDYPEIKRNRDVFEYLRKVVERMTDKDEAIERARKGLDGLLDTSVAAKGDLAKESHRAYIMDSSQQIDLSKLDFESLRLEFPKKKHKAISFADLRELLAIKLKQMLAANSTRGSFLENFERVIEDYNTGSLELSEAYEKLLKQAAALSKEEERAARLNMSQEEMQIFDLLKKEKLTKSEEKEVITAAKKLLKTLYDAKSNVLIQNWYLEKAAQETVRNQIQEVLADTLPDPGYDRSLFAKKVDVTYQHFYGLAERG